MFYMTDDIIDKSLARSFVGVDEVIKKFNEVKQSAASLNYPPYNIKRSGDNKYTIEMAVAGFGKQDIEIELADDKLKISGNTDREASADTTYLYRGLGLRPFTHLFSLNGNIEVKEAKLVNGILRVFLESITPLSSKKKIDINDDSSNPEFLVEDN